MRADRLIPVLSAGLALLITGCAVPVKFERPAQLTPAEAEGYVRMNLIKGARSGEKQKMNFFTSLNPDCSAIEGTSITVVTPPAHGTMTVEPGEVYPGFAKDNVRSACNTRKVAAEILYYQSEPGYVGKDFAVLDVVFPFGNIRHQTYVITVE